MKGWKEGRKTEEWKEGRMKRRAEEWMRGVSTRVHLNVHALEEWMRGLRRGVSESTRVHLNDLCKRHPVQRHPPVVQLPP